MYQFFRSFSKHVLTLLHVCIIVTHYQLQVLTASLSAMHSAVLRIQIPVCGKIMIFSVSVVEVLMLFPHSEL